MARAQGAEADGFGAGRAGGAASAFRVRPWVWGESRERQGTQVGTGIRYVYARDVACMSLNGVAQTTWWFCNYVPQALPSLPPVINMVCWGRRCQWLLSSGSG